MSIWLLQVGFPLPLDMVEIGITSPGVSFVVNPKFYVNLGSNQAVFQSKDPEEEAFFTFNVSRWMSASETILSAVFEIKVADSSLKSDPAYASMLSGQSHIIGDEVIQKIIKGVDGVTYDLSVLFTTTLDKSTAYQILKGSAVFLVETY
jgi:hypothetical protein